MGASAELKAYLEWMREGGVEWLPASRPNVSPAPDLQRLKQTVAACTKCAPLACARTQTVFGSGNQRAQLVFVGEAPGEEEDRQGLPFVGAAGLLLTKMIESIGTSRADVYICNVLKCRPPGNRPPEASEIANCLPYLNAQLDYLKPRVICALGRVAAQTLLGTTLAISQLRGRFHDYHGTPVMPTFHPAYLLRNASEKRKVWEDLKSVRDFLRGHGMISEKLASSQRPQGSFA